jgi:hypothetical protein
VLGTLDDHARAIVAGRTSGQFTDVCRNNHREGFTSNPKTKEEISKVPQTKAQRSAAARKAAATRKRNAASRSQRSAKSSARDAGADVTKAVTQIRKTAEKSIEAVRKRADAEVSRIAGNARR